MTVNIEVMSIDVNGLDSWFDYGDVLLEVADEVTAFRRKYKSQITQQQKNTLRSYAEKLQEYSREIATIAAINKLEDLDAELTQLKEAITKIDGFLRDVNNTRGAISGLAEAVGVIVNILNIVT